MTIPSNEAPAPRSLWRRWQAWAGYAAAAWSLAYGTLGVYWALGGLGFPFGYEHDPAARLSLLAGARAATAAPVIAALGLIGAAAAVTMARTWGRGMLRAVLLAFAWTAAATLALAIPDYRVLMVTAYAPIMLIGAPFGWPPGENFFDALTGPVMNQFACIGGGVLWAMAALAYQRRIRAAGGAAGWTTPAAAARWGRWAVSVAVIVPVLYAVTRWAWALGIPLGISEELLREGQAVGVWWAGAGLATVAIVGAILTLGLIQRWGEIFPRWLPFLAGKRVPSALAIAPAALVSILVTTAGLMFIRLMIFGGFSLGNGFALTLEEDWAALAPELLWPIWGAALGAATLAYYLRRRGERSSDR